MVTYTNFVGWLCKTLIDEDRFEVKLSSWIGMLLSYGDRLILINSALTSLPMFLLSFLEIPVRVWKQLDFLNHVFLAKRWLQKEI
jgi:hypothetical protein